MKKPRFAALVASIVVAGVAAIYFAPHAQLWLGQRQLAADIAEAEALAASQLESRNRLIAALPRLRVQGVRYVELWSDAADGASKSFQELKVNSGPASPIPAAASKLRSSFYRMLTTEPEMVAACFDPHHAVSLSDGKQSFDVLVCFNCNRYRVYSADGGFWGAFSANERAIWDAIFAEAGLEIPQSAREPGLATEPGTGV